MSVPFVPGVPGFALTPTSQNANTAVTALVPPFPGNQMPPFLYNFKNSLPNWYGNLYTHLTRLIYTTGATAHTITVLRPLNWCLISTALAKNTTAITLDKDPGVYSTNYRYPLPNAQTAPTLVADAAISSTNKYVAYQMDDGIWQLDTIASGTFGGGNLVLATGTPNRTGATVRANSPLFYFGATTLANPQTGIAHINFTTIASGNKTDQIGSYNGEGITGLNPGDPLLVISNNITNAGVFDLVAGDYRKF